MKKVLLMATAGLVCLFAGSSLVYADDAKVSDFIGEYIGDMPEVDKYANPDVMKLYFNDDGNLERYSGLFYGTTGTTICYEYTDYEINENVMTCEYDGAFSPYTGPRSDISGGIHEYTLQDDGNISSDGHIWYRYLTDEEKAQQEQSRTLASADDTDFTEGKYSDDFGFLGTQDVKRSSIEEIAFLNTLEQKPEDAWDISENQDGSVYAWLNTDSETKTLNIAADGEIIANIDCENLFRLCSHVKKIDFNNCFDTSQTESMKNMFADCKELEEIAGIDNWDTSSVTDMEGMFYGCEKLQSFDLSCLDTSGAYIFNKMFYNCSSLQEIDIDDFPKGDAIEYDDIFTGTVREGDAPGLTQERNRRVLTSYILDTQNVLTDDNLLRAKVVNSYDDVLKNLDHLTHDLSDVMYAIHDINGDKIPEMIMKRKVDNFFVYSGYTYNKKSGRVEGIDGVDFEAASNVLEYIPEKNTIIYMTQDGNYHICIWKNDQFVEDSVVDYYGFEDMKDVQKMNFRYAYPEVIWSAEFGEVEDNSDEDDNTESEDTNKKYTVSAYAEKNETGYASIILYVDNQNVFTIQADGKTTQTDISGYRISDGTAWLYVRMYSDLADDYCGILQYKDDQMKEVLSLESTVNEMQLVTEREHNYFDLDNLYGDGTKVNAMDVTYHLTPIAYGEDFTFSMKYDYSDEGVEQRYYLADLQNTSSEEYTLSKDKEIYAQIAGTEVKYKAKGGTKLTPDKIWLGNGLIWIRVKNEDGKEGWVPMSAESPFLENSYDPGSGVKKKIEENQDNTVYFKDSVVPDKDTLYDLAGASYAQGNYDDAIIYYQFFHFLDPHYFDAKKGIRQAEKMLKEEGSSSETEKAAEADKEKEEETKKETEVQEIKGENTDSKENDTKTNSSKKKEAKKKARKELMAFLRSQNVDKKHPLAYATVDLDQDGIKEIMTRSYSVDETHDAGEYTYDVYQYDSKCEQYKHLSYATFENAQGYDLYFWEDQEYLVVDSGMGLVNYTLYTLEDGMLKKETDTSSDMSYLPQIEFKDIKQTADTEGKVYRKYLQCGKFQDDVKWLQNVSFSIYDVNGDGVKELIFKGWDNDNQRYQYLIYSCKDKEVQYEDSFENWQNGGNGEIYVNGTAGRVIVNTRLADRQTYTIYNVTEGIEPEYSVSRYSADEKNDQGEYERVYVYTTLDSEGNETDAKISTDDQWAEFENFLTEIPFYKVSWSIDEMQENLQKEKEKKAAKAKKKTGKQDSYASVLSNAEAQYGTYTLSTMQNIQYAYGVCYLELRDLNNDGVQEFFMVHNTDLKDDYGSLKLDSYEYEIWTMAAGEAVLLETGHLYYSNGGWPSVCWAEHDGNTYLVTNYDNADSCWFHGFKPDGTFGVVDEFLFEYTDTGFTTKINGVETDRDTWIAQRDQYMANTTQTCLYYEGADNVYPMVESVKNTLTGGENTTESTEAAETTETSAPATDASEYLLPEVTSRFLNQSEVESFSLDQLQLAINEIFARHGRCFKTAEIDSYFRSKSWYQPDASKTDEQIVAEFNEYEKANEELLEKVREAKQN